MIMLVYLGIRVLLISTAEKKSKYKTILLDWVKGIAILFLFPYIIRYTITLNHALVTYIYEKSEGFLTTDNQAVIRQQSGGIAGSNNGYEIVDSDNNYMMNMYKAAKKDNLAAAICWFVMLFQILQFLLVYFKRLITVMFLIAIFPLVTISYALDKIADGKSQAFNSWCKEFILQVFIQSFHAINYVLVMGLICKLTPENWLLKIMGIAYVTKGGDIIKSMFAQIKGTKGGGPLEVAKTVVGTKVAIGAVKSLGKFASATVGSKSVLGKGLNLLGSAYDYNLERQTTKHEKKRNEALRNAGYLLNNSGTVVPKLSEEQIRSNVGDLLNKNGKGNLSDEEFKQKIDQLSNVDPDELNRIVSGMGLSEAELNDLSNLLTVATANEVVKGARNGKPNVEIKRSADYLINIRNNVKNGTASDNVKRYVNMDNNVSSYNRLKGVAAANSIVIDEEAAIARASSPAQTFSNEEEKVRHAMKVIKDASNGYGVMELKEQLEIALDANNDSSLKHIVEEEMEETNFTLQDFALNLDVQTINNSDNPIFYSDDKARRLLNESIKNVVEIKNNSISQTNRLKQAVDGRILAGLNAKVEDLQEDELPQLFDRELQRKKSLEKAMNTRLSELQEKFENDTGIQLDANVFLDKGQEYDEYLDNKQAEFRKMAVQDVTKGVVETLVGSGVATLKMGYGTATSGVMLGTSMEGKNDPVTEILTNVPTGYNMVNEVSGKVGGIVEKPLSAIDSRVVGDRVSLKNNQSSMQINEKYYANQAKSEHVNSQITQEEAKRQALLKRLNSRINGGS